MSTTRRQPFATPCTRRSEKDLGRSIRFRGTCRTTCFSFQYVAAAAYDKQKQVLRARLGELSQPL